MSGSTPPSKERTHAPPARIVGGIIVFGMFLAILMGALDQFVVLTALPRIVVELGQSSGVSLVISAYLISSTIGIAVFGRLTDMFSRRAVFLAGLATFLPGSLLSGLSQNLNQLIAFRALQGFSSGAFIIIGFAIAASLFPPATRARIAGLFSGSFVVATIFGPLLGSYIVDHASWRWVFFVNLPIGAVTVLILLTSLGQILPERRGRFDVPGALLLAGWISAALFGLVQISDGGWSVTDWRVLGLFTSAGLLFLAFVLWELRTAAPLVALTFFRIRLFSASGVVAFFRGAVLSSELAFIAIFSGLVLVTRTANSADIVRNLLYWLLVPGVVGAALGSQLVVRFGYRPVTVAGLALSLVGTVLLAYVSNSGVLLETAFRILPTGGIAAALPLIGGGIGLTIPVTLLAGQFSVPKREVGSATAMIQFLGVLGGALAVSLLTVLQESAAALLTPAMPAGGCVPGPSTSGACGQYAQELYHATVLSFQWVFAAEILLMAVALVASLWMMGRVPTLSDPSTLPRPATDSPA